MATPFSRTTRSLDGDSYRLMLIFVPALLLFFCAWGIWFSFAQVALYTVSESATLRSDSSLVANFPAAALLQLKVGQTAQFHLDGVTNERYTPIPATVVNVANRLRDGYVEVRLILQPETTSTVPLQRGLTGRVEIETEQVSPATLVLRTIGVQEADISIAR